MTVTDIGLMMVGFFIGNLIVSRVALWIGLVLETLETSSQGWRMAIAASLFTEGPWMLLAFGVFAYFVRSEPWGPWLIGGAVAALAGGIRAAWRLGPAARGQAHMQVDVFGGREATRIPLAYGAFCATFDWAVAVYFAYRRRDWIAAWSQR